MESQEESQNSKCKETNSLLYSWETKRKITCLFKKPFTDAREMRRSPVFWEPQFLHLALADWTQSGMRSIPTYVDAHLVDNM